MVQARRIEAANGAGANEEDVHRPLPDWLAGTEERTEHRRSYFTRSLELMVAAGISCSGMEVGQEDDFYAVGCLPAKRVDEGKTLMLGSRHSNPESSIHKAGRRARALVTFRRQTHNRHAISRGEVTAQLRTADALRKSPSNSTHVGNMMRDRLLLSTA